MIQFITDGTTPGFNFYVASDPSLIFWFGYRWRKFGMFLRLIVAPPQGNWFNVAAGVEPQWNKTSDNVHSPSFIATVRLILTASIELQFRIGERDVKALAKLIKDTMDEAERNGAKFRPVDSTGDPQVQKVINDLNAETPPDKGKMN